MWYYFSRLGEANGYAFAITVTSLLVMMVCTLFTSGYLVLQARPGFGRHPDGGLMIGFVRHVPKQLRVPLSFPVPGELIVVVLGEIISAATNLEREHDVATVGEIPLGLPPTRNLDWGEAKLLITNKMFEVGVISLVAIALTIADGSTYAERFDTPLSLNREIVRVVST